MSTWFLLNSISLNVGNGVQKILPGATLDDAIIPLATLQAAGASLWPTSDPVMAAASLRARNTRRVAGNETLLESIMLQAALQAGESAKRTVAYAGASLPAKAVAVHAQIAGGAALNATTGFTLPLPRRSLQVLIGTGGAACVITATGTAVDGTPLVKTAVVTAAGTFDVGNGADVFETLTSLTSNVDPVGTTDLQTGTGFGVGMTYQSTVAPVLGVDGVVEAVVATSPTTGGVKPTTATNGTHAYAVEFVATQGP